MSILKAKKYLLRQCGHGNVCACKKAKQIFASEKIEVYAAAFAMVGAESEKEHVNKMPFSGALLVLDAPSTKPPHGSRGHRIYVSKAVATKHLSGLIGMAVNYDSQDLDSHVTRHKVGVISKAWIKGDQVWVSGFVWKKDFPEAVKDLKRGGLGMSMELADVYVRDENEAVWHLEKFEFTGATILKKSAAAYYQTSLVANAKTTAMVASAAAASGYKEKGESMAQEKVKKTIAAAGDSNQGALLVAAIRGAMNDALGPLVSEVRASNERQSALSNDMEELKGFYMIQAAATTEDEDVDIDASHEEDEEDMEAAGKKPKQDQEDDEDDEDGEEDDLEAMEDLEEEKPEEEPGELNKDAKNQGNKTTVENKVGQKVKVPGGVSEGRLKSAGMKAGKPFPGLKSSGAMQAAAVEISSLHAQLQSQRKATRKVVSQMQAQEASFKKQMRKFGAKYEALEAQAEKWSEQVERKSVIPVEIRSLAAKAQVDLSELKAEGRKLSVGDVDRMFQICAQQGIAVDTLKRAELKARMHQLGLMDGGEQPLGEYSN